MRVVATDLTGQNNTATIRVVVQGPQLRVLIAGGDRNVGISQSLLLDASASHGVNNLEEQLRFRWTCDAVDENVAHTGVCNGTIMSTSATLQRAVRVLSLRHARACT